MILVVAINVLPIIHPLKLLCVFFHAEMKCSNESLTGNYQTFTQNKADSYVAYVKEVQESSKIDPYDIEIGDGSTSLHGYFNGKLNPLGSYRYLYEVFLNVCSWVFHVTKCHIRNHQTLMLVQLPWLFFLSPFIRACVAGFTHIIFTNDYINSRESYVSFTKFSGAVDLPQNPGTIIIMLLLLCIWHFSGWTEACSPQRCEVIVVRGFFTDSRLYFSKIKVRKVGGVLEKKTPMNFFNLLKQVKCFLR